MISYEHVLEREFTLGETKPDVSIPDDAWL